MATGRLRVAVEHNTFVKVLFNGWNMYHWWYTDGRL